MSVDRDQYDRVTKILAPFSGMDKIAPAVLAKAAARGTVIHSLCQGWIDGIDVDVPKTVTFEVDGVEYEADVELQGYLDSFKRWAEGKEFLKNPGRMYADDFQITGECDGLFVMEDGQKWLFDLKTSATESCTWKYQSAAYDVLLQLDKEIKVDGEVFVRLSKDGKKAKEHMYTDPKRWGEFFSALTAYRTFFKNKLPINVEDL